MFATLHRGEHEACCAGAMALFRQTKAAAAMVALICPG
jgi:hypothetical protein